MGGSCFGGIVSDVVGSGVCDGVDGGVSDVES